MRLSRRLCASCAPVCRGRAGCSRWRSLFSRGGWVPWVGVLTLASLAVGGWRLLAGSVRVALASSRSAGGLAFDGSYAHVSSCRLVRRAGRSLAAWGGVFVFAALRVSCVSLSLAPGPFPHCSAALAFVLRAGRCLGCRGLTPVGSARVLPVVGSRPLYCRCVVAIVAAGWGRPARWAALRSPYLGGAAVSCFGAGGRRPGPWVGWTYVRWPAARAVSGSSCVSGGAGGRRPLPYVRAAASRRRARGRWRCCAVSAFSRLLCWGPRGARPPGARAWGARPMFVARAFFGLWRGALSVASGRRRGGPRGRGWARRRWGPGGCTRVLCGASGPRGAVPVGRGSAGRAPGPRRGACPAAAVRGGGGASPRWRGRGASRAPGLHAPAAGGAGGLSFAVAGRVGRFLSRVRAVFAAGSALLVRVPARCGAISRAPASGAAWRCVRREVRLSAALLGCLSSYRGPLACSCRGRCLASLVGCSLGLVFLVSSSVGRGRCLAAFVVVPRVLVLLCAVGGRSGRPFDSVFGGCVPCAFPLSWGVGSFFVVGPVALL